MLNRSEILHSAWADYRRDVAKGWGVKRNGPFCRRHFAYCLQQAWLVAKERAAKAGAEIAERKALITEAGRLNNHPALVNVDQVTLMGFMDVAECRRHVAKLKDMIRDFERPAAVKARIEALRTELRQQDFDDFVDWTRRRHLQGELAQLLAT